MTGTIQAVRYKDSTYAFKKGSVEEFTRSLSSAYHVVAIFGVQGSGKSTLLNQLFGTDFTVLDGGDSPRPTTEGIWWSVVPMESGPLLIMDVEGCDSTERNDNLDRKCALFALTVADVLLFNISRNHVFHRESAGQSLLQCILKILLTEEKLREQRHRRAVVAVLRDLSEPPPPYLQGVSSNDLRSGGVSLCGSLLRSAPSGLRSGISAACGGGSVVGGIAWPTGLKSFRSGSSILRTAAHGLAAAAAAAAAGGGGGAAATGGSYRLWAMGSGGPGAGKEAGGLEAVQEGMPALLGMCSSVETEVGLMDLVEVLKEQFEEMRLEVQAAVGDVLMAHYPDVDFKDMPDMYKKEARKVKQADGSVKKTDFEEELQGLKKLLTPGDPGSLLRDEHRRFVPAAVFEELWAFIDGHTLLNEAAPEEVTTAFLRGSDLDEKIRAFKSDDRWTRLAACEGFVPDFVSQAHEVWWDHVRRMDVSAASPMGVDLLAELRRLVQPVYEDQIQHLRWRTKTLLDEMRSPELVPDADFAERARLVQEEVVAFFRTGIRQGLEGTPWGDDASSQALLEREIEQTVVTLMEHRFQELMHAAVPELDTRLAPKVRNCLKNCHDTNVWPELHRACCIEADSSKHLEELRGVLGEEDALMALREAAVTAMIGHVQEFITPAPSSLNSFLDVWLREHTADLARTQPELDAKERRAAALRRVAAMLVQFTVVRVAPGEVPAASAGHDVHEFIERVLSTGDNRATAKLTNWAGVEDNPSLRVLLPPQDLKVHLTTLLHCQGLKEDADPKAAGGVIRDLQEVIGAASKAVSEKVSDWMSPLWAVGHVAGLLLILFVVMTLLRWAGRLTGLSFPFVN